MKLLVDISDIYGFPAYLSISGIVYKDADVELADENDEFLKQWERTELLEAKETNIIKLVVRGRSNDSYLECDSGEEINIEKLLLLYFFPNTKSITDPYWKNKSWLCGENGHTGIRGLQWAEVNPMLFNNGSAYRSDSKTKLKYISLEGKYYRLRIKKIKYSCLFAKLEDAVKKRDTLLL